ncbi:C-type mannose receptor 2-like [Acipenser ruthenus]|uniref:C-type mannose receptor 2-like n=1 Tax=Acipenser ruthenus TaxID=7906 RepID=UPI002741442E|nr:C-type mannose receptor 2-like [Acipenser ruthenus]
MGERGLLILLLAGLCVPVYNQIRKYVFVETVKGWSEAQRYCRENHIDLATVRSQEEATQLLSIVGASVRDSWIGLYRDDTQNWQWSNSDDVIYSNWRADVFCASVNSDGKWTDLPCHLQKAFMCYKETSNITERYTLIEELKTWTEAQQYCREHHTDLVSIKNASENEELVKKAQGKPFWIGLFNEPWKWSHQGDNYTFHNWSNGEPNNGGGDENCVKMSKKGEWNDAPCNNQKSFFCCEDSDPTSPPSTPVSRLI